MNISRRPIQVAVAAACAAALVTPAAGSAAAPTADERIVGGQTAKEGVYPFATRLQVAYGKDTVILCTGTLISQDIVLTSQQCLAERRGEGKPKSIVADIGRVDYTKAAEAGQRRTGVQYQLGRGVGKGDWAVVKLGKALKLRDYPLLPADEAFDRERSYRALGWGKTANGRLPNLLQQVDLPRVAPKLCGDNSDVELCAGDLADGGVGFCGGDIGGPLLAADEDWIQVGIASHTESCGDKGDPQHFTRVSAFTHKIQAAITLLDGTPASEIPADGGDDQR
ncbi:MAG TPA: serine protease [Pilimelia sp.]|nr:serine protease [Pilimelia sp.]